MGKGSKWQLIAERTSQTRLKFENKYECLFWISVHMWSEWLRPMWSKTCEPFVIDSLKRPQLTTGARISHNLIKRNPNLLSENVDQRYNWPQHGNVSSQPAHSKSTTFSTLDLIEGKLHWFADSHFVHKSLVQYVSIVNRSAVSTLTLFREFLVSSALISSPLSSFSIISALSCI